MARWWERARSSTTTCRRCPEPSATPAPPLRRCRLTSTLRSSRTSADEWWMPRALPCPVCTQRAGSSAVRWGSSDTPRATRSKPSRISLPLPPVDAEDGTEVLALLDARGIEHTNWQGWLALDAHERALGEEFDGPVT